MNEESYQVTELRDSLAADRTMLANERTLLAYIRTAIMLFVSGVTILKIFENTPFLVGLGYFLVLVALLVGAWGYFHFRSVGLRIAEKQKRMRKTTELR